MQNFTDQHLPVVQVMITVPTAGGAEAFVEAADIGAVAVETLADPHAHAGAVYAPTGPEVLTVAEVVGIIAGAVGRSIIHNDIERSAWIDGAIAAGAIPRGYRVMLNWLTATIASGHRSRPNDDVRRVTGSPPARFYGLRPSQRPRLGPPGGALGTGRSVASHGGRSRADSVGAARW
jgi:uncharacterized protein YbjT (DUF2867 family)